jgi:assimilatory nitrate reductase catalytic subunit
VEISLRNAAIGSGPELAYPQGMTPQERIGLLSGRAREQGADPGPTVCACFGVGRNTIRIAVERHGLQDAAAVTACVKAGGNCGSCVPEIRALLAEAAVKAQC